jgi:putative aldouronate transport system permease protein
MNIKRSSGNLAADSIIMLFLGLYAIISVLPFVYIIAASLMPQTIVTSGSIFFIPKKISFESYRYIFSTRTVLQGFKISVFVTTIGTVFNILMTVIFAYPLSHSDMKGRRIILFLVTFTMLFSGGMIPGYILIKNLHLINTLASLILPGAISTFNFVIFRNYFHDLPKELEESAMIDGAGYFRILAQIIMPISTALIATFIIMYGVGHWNSWFSATLYITDSTKWPVQVILRMIIDVSTGVGDTQSMPSQTLVPPQNVRMSIIVVVTLPILLVYPFMQKYFTKGMLLGSIKG